MSEDHTMTVAVTGSTGFVGRHIVRTLVNRGCTVRALIRDPDKARTTLPVGNVHTVQGDLNDPRSLDTLLEGCQAVVHTVGIIREPHPGDFDKIHVDGTRAILEAAGRNGVSRVIHISALGVRANAPTGYQQSKYAAEKLVRSSGLDWTILRPSLIHGPDGEFMQMVRDMAIGRQAPFVCMPWFARVEITPPVPKPVSARVQPVAVDDVAAAAAACLDRPATIGEVYPLGGSESLTWPEIMEAVRDEHPLATKKKRTCPVPAQLGWAVATVARPLGLAEAIPFGPSEALMATEDSTCSNDKAIRHFGFTPSPFRAGLKSYVAEL